MLIETPRITAVDLFCGAGGLTHGLTLENIDVSVGFDVDSSCRYPYEENQDSVFVLKSVADLKGSELCDYWGTEGFSLLAGCAPCQPFSGYNRGRDHEADERWILLKAFSRLIEESMPDVVTMENVPRLAKLGIFSDFHKTLDVLGYHTSWKIVRCEDYGVPQRRRRLVLLASKHGPIELEIPQPLPEEAISVKEAIGDLPELKAGGASQTDSLHRCSKLSDKNLKRIQHSKPGGTWRDWPEALVAPCHSRSSGQTYIGVYGRMAWDQPSPTITTQATSFGSGRFGHPEQDRAISLREAAILQSFPSNYKFIPPGEQTTIRPLMRLIGNAVPVKLGQAIGRSIISHLGNLQ